MPVNTADSFGGVILTDWHTPPEAPSERFKLNVYILDRKLRADGVRVAVFRQIQDRTGNWKDAAVPDETGIKIEYMFSKKIAGRHGRRPHPNHHRATIVLWIHILFAFFAADPLLEY